MARAARVWMLMELMTEMPASKSSFTSSQRLACGEPGGLSYARPSTRQHKQPR